jgi:hypothetical protein
MTLFIRTKQNLLTFHKSYILQSQGCRTRQKYKHSTKYNNTNINTSMQCNSICRSYNMKITAFWNRVPCSLEVDQCFSPDDGGSTHLWNVNLQRDYTEIFPKRLSSLHLSPWEPDILRLILLYYIVQNMSMKYFLHLCKMARQWRWPV